MPHTPVSTVRTVSIKLLVPLWLFTVPLPATATDQSRFADQLDSSSYPSIKVRSEPVDMRWDFSRGKRYNYDYTQQGTLIFKVRGFPGDGPVMMSQKVDAGGSVNLESLFNNRARLRVKLDAEIDAILPGGDRQTLSESTPPYVIEDYSDRGIYRPQNPDMDFAINSLMSLPPAALRPGDSLEKQVLVPFSVNYEQHMMPATMKLTLTGLASCHGHTCAEMAMETTATDYTPPAGVPGEFDVSLSSRGKAWFDLDNGKLVESMVASRLQISAEVPPVPENAREAEELEKNPYLLHVVMENDHFMRISENPDNRSGPKKITLKKYRRGEIQKTD